MDERIAKLQKIAQELTALSAAALREDGWNKATDARSGEAIAEFRAILKEIEQGREAGRPWNKWQRTGRYEAGENRSSSFQCFERRTADSVPNMCHQAGGRVVGHFGI
jgi:hypothetical protein